jgi:hypothetical protein
VRIQQAQLVGRDEHKARFVQTTAACAPEHLQKFLGLEQLFHAIAAVTLAGKRDAAQGEVNARRQAHGGDYHPELAGLGERFDHARPRAIAQAAVMVGDAGFQQLGQMVADNQLLVGAQGKGIGGGQLAGEVGGHGFGSLAARGEDQNRPQVLGQRLGDKPRPETLYV